MTNRKTTRMKAYRIRDWSKHFENNRTRDMDKMRWVPVPNKHDGEGFLTIMAEPDGLQIYGAWNLILQTASKSHPRGTLLRDDGTPMTARVIALKTSCRDVSIIQRALEVCASKDVGWLEEFEVGCDETAPACGNPAPSCVEGRKEGRNGREGIEGNGMEGKQPAKQQNLQTNPPTLQDCLNAAATISMRPADVEAAYHHYTAQGWVTGAGVPIRNLSSVLAKWKANQENHEAKGKHHDKPKDTRGEYAGHSAPRVI